ncbi:MAG: hypothetical protein ACFFB9_02915 [Promethearchaeota archaeon]
MTEKLMYNINLIKNGLAKMRKTNLSKTLLFIITFTIFFPYFLPISYSNEIGIQSGLHINHLHSLSIYPEEIPTTLTFTKTSENIFHVKWRWGSPFDDTGSWDVNISTNIVSNMQNWGPENDSHNWAWIYTDIVLNDQIIIFNVMKEMNTGDGDTLYNVTGEAMHGTIEVWVLEDEFGSEVWYEKERGFLVNGTNKHSTAWEKFDFVSVSVDQGIPGYSYFLLFGAILGFGVLLIRYKLKKKN